jgi:hypothetical protein
MTKTYQARVDSGTDTQCFTSPIQRSTTYRDLAVVDGQDYDLAEANDVCAVCHGTDPGWELPSHAKHILTLLKSLIATPSSHL